MDWIIDNYIEIIGAVLGVLFLFFEIRQSAWLWPTGILTSLFYIYIFYVAKFYADMGLQVYYVLVSVYGWYYWLKGKGSDEKSLPVVHLSKTLGVNLVWITLLIYASIAYVLVSFTDSPLPYWDAFTTALSITATWMLARKILEQWWLWIVVNVVSLGLYVYKGLYPTVVLFAFYSVLAFVGYRQWRRSMVQ